MKYQAFIAKGKIHYVAIAAAVSSHVKITFFFHV